jgi:hypothetical protein
MLGFHLLAHLDVALLHEEIRVRVLHADSASDLGIRGDRTGAVCSVEFLFTNEVQVLVDGVDFMEAMDLGGPGGAGG